MLVTQSCPTLRDPMDWSPPGSSVHRIFQARKLEWVAIPFFRDTQNLDPRTTELGSLRGPPQSWAVPEGSIPRHLPSPGLVLAVLQNAEPHVKAASARTSASSARGGFTCTRESVCPPARQAPRPSRAHGSARVSGGICPALPPPSLEQGLVRGVKRPGRNHSRMSRDDGKPNAMSGTHRNPSMH